MTDLNLAELDRLEREATAEPWRGFFAGPSTGWAVDALGEDSDMQVCLLTERTEKANAELIAAARSQLRPLLDMLTGAMRSLRGAGRDACPTFKDCRHDTCVWRRSVLEEYQRAGGVLK